MAEFPNRFGVYIGFEESVKRRTRYLYESDVHDFLAAVRATSSSRLRKISKDRILWRAQLGHASQPVILDAAKVWTQRVSGPLEIGLPAPFPPDRMLPDAKLAREGRVNPKGIPCLYLADDAETAMAEVRPCLWSYVSLAQFRMKADALVIDCSFDDNGCNASPDEQSDDPAERERAVWSDIAEAFSAPVTLNDSDTDYVPTQILAELFRSEGCEGIGYKSRLGRGRNIALFRLDAAEFVTCDLYSTKRISFTFQKQDVVGRALRPLLLDSDTAT